MYKAPTKVFSKYADFADVFLSKLAIKCPKYIGTNHYTIELVNHKKPIYYPISDLGLMELELLKAFIKNNLPNGFIWPSKFAARVFFTFNNQKPDESITLYID